VHEGLAMSGGVHWSFDGDKARRELGFAPRSLDAGLREVMEFYRRAERGNHVGLFVS
jgi:hypothetical protein